MIARVSEYDAVGRATRAAGFVLAALLISAATAWVGIQSSRGVAPAAALAGGVCIVGFATFALKYPIAQRRVLARWVIWLGFVAPLATVVQRTTESVSSAPVTGLSVFEAAAPALAFLIAMALGAPRLGRISPVEVAALAYLAVILASSVWSVDGTATVFKASQLAVIYALIALLVRIGSMDEIVAELGGWLTAIVVACLIGFVVDNGSSFAATPADPTTRRLHGVFPFVSPDFLGFVSACTIVFCAAGIGPRWMRGHVPRVTIGLVALSTLGLSRSRTGLAAAVVGLVVLSVVGRSRRAQLIILAPVTAAGVLLGGVLSAGLFTELIRRNQSAENLTSLTGRTAEWHAALSAWHASPFLGQGYYSAHRLGTLTSQFHFQLSNLDNTWVETLLDVGLVGLVPLAAVVLLGGLALIRIDAEQRSVPTLRALWTAALITSFLNPTVEAVGYPLVVFGIVIAVAGHSVAVTRSTPA